METYSRIGLLRSYGNLQSYFTSESTDSLDFFELIAFLSPNPSTRFTKHTLETSGEHVKNTLEMSGKHVKNTLETSGEHVKNTLETSGENVKNTLETGGEDSHSSDISSVSIERTVFEKGVSLKYKMGWATESLLK